MFNSLLFGKHVLQLIVGIDVGDGHQLRLTFDDVDKHCPGLGVWARRTTHTHTLTRTRSTNFESTTNVSCENFNQGRERIDSMT